MSEAHDTPADLRPLRLVPGYDISADGSVFRSKDGSEVQSFTLHQARRYASADIGFDHNRMSRQPLGPVEPESLVYIGEEEVFRWDGNGWKVEVRKIEMVQSVRLPTGAELDPLFKGDGITVSHAWAAGGPMPAVGDTSRGWYRLDHDGAKVLFHGASLAAHERQQM